MTLGFVVDNIVIKCNALAAGHYKTLSLKFCLNKCKHTVYANNLRPLPGDSPRGLEATEVI